MSPYRFSGLGLYKWVRTPPPPHLPTLYLPLIHQQVFFQVLEVSDVGDKVLAIGEGSMEQYNRDFMVAAGFGAQQRVENVTNATSRATAFFNNQAYHTVAISLSMLGNGLLQYLTGNPSHTIETINHPLPRTTQAKLEQDMGNTFKYSVDVLRYTY